MNNFSVFEVLMLLCFAISWPISIVKALRTKIVIGKSPVFMMLIIVGYVFGIIHKILYNNDLVTWLWVFNTLLVSFDLILYFYYIGKNKAELHGKNKDNKTSR
ncbi:MAG: hypothetical protein PHU62_08980 [Bacteroidales bacterium]|jgi:hypothetical protein|nr:hypothetical protein [Bacteroidales bacterium]MDD2205131.1 hypothetical protein [Bacteroidales bacterium]MDD3151485.1 hypothetical protein [Bacteroidales bacterium]MDD3914898.1 hypothetical protein [Bacteroidales bacterium]MDD4634683.1 hypothetical protein [Bacteroidales bacterium]